MHATAASGNSQPRGGVAGRGFIAYRYFCFFSAGFSICKVLGVRDWLEV